MRFLLSTFIVSTSAISITLPADHFHDVEDGLHPNTTGCFHSFHPLYKTIRIDNEKNPVCW